MIRDASKAVANIFFIVELLCVGVMKPMEFAYTYAAFWADVVGLNPNRSLYHLSISLGCFHRFLFIFYLLVGILPVLFSRRSRPRLQK